VVLSGVIMLFPSGGGVGGAGAGSLVLLPSCDPSKCSSDPEV